MVYNIFETESAKSDIEEILAYLLDVLHSPSAATSFLDDIEHIYGNLQCMPMMYGKCELPKAQMLGLRKVPIGNYIMLYSVDDDCKKIIIYRYFYAGREYARFL